MTRQHNCADCTYLRRTSPGQVFLLCEFWAGAPAKGVKEAYDHDFIIGHCHMQPEAPACAFFEHRQVSDATDAA